MAKVIRLKRVYEKPSTGDGYRILVDRVWPRGLTKKRARIDHWVRDVAPSTRLRKWFGHDPARWAEFKRRYNAELKGKSGVLRELRHMLREHSRATLVFGARDEKHNNAVALRPRLR
ncbi:MAG: DUF488 domain-containing protein [Bacillota bacterium]